MLKNIVQSLELVPLGSCPAMLSLLLLNSWHYSEEFATSVYIIWYYFAIFYA